MILKKNKKLLSLRIMKKLQSLATILLLMGMVACGDEAPKQQSSSTKTSAPAAKQQTTNTEVTPSATILYGIDPSDYIVEELEIQRGDNVGPILQKRHGVPMVKVLELEKAAESVFSVKKLQAGKKYTLFMRDNVAEYMVYHINDTEYVVYDISTETPTAKLGDTK
jgi:hypothetical protein